ncbi:hypothetical protein Plhal703r1_c15g0074291 [Plasmopara halstedii]
MARVSRSSVQLTSVCASRHFAPYGMWHHFTIQKNLKYDKWYFVDLTRLQKDVTDQAIYDWFVLKGSKLVLITPTRVYGRVKSRGRTVYFNSVGCPAGLFVSIGAPLREIHFDSEEKPCFVQYRPATQVRSG